MHGIRLLARVQLSQVDVVFDKSGYLHVPVLNRCNCESKYVEKSVGIQTGINDIPIPVFILIP